MKETIWNTILLHFKQNLLIKILFFKITESSIDNFYRQESKIRIINDILHCFSKHFTK